VERGGRRTVDDGVVGHKGSGRTRTILGGGVAGGAGGVGGAGFAKPFEVRVTSTHPVELLRELLGVAR
jgi:hypothetical protein